MSALEPALALSRCMLQSAAEGDWASVQLLEDERRALLEQVFKGPNVPDATCEEDIRLMLTMNENLAEILKQHQQSLMQNIQELRQGQKAVAAYDSNR